MFKKPTPPTPPPPPPPARRVTDSADAATTVLGPTMRIKGDVAGGDSVDLMGDLEGNCRVTGLIRVRAGGSIVGDLSATNIVVEGDVSADSLSADKVEIGIAARVRGDIRARLVAIAEGARFDGQIQMEGSDGSAAPLAFKEKRKRVP